MLEPRIVDLLKVDLSIIDLKNSILYTLSILI